MEGLEGLLPILVAELLVAGPVEAEAALPGCLQVLRHVLVVAPVQPHEVGVHDLEREEEGDDLQLVPPPIHPVAVEDVRDLRSVAAQGHDLGQRPVGRARRGLRAGPGAAHVGHVLGPGPVVASQGAVLGHRAVVARSAVEVEEEQEVPQLAVHVPEDFCRDGHLRDYGLLLEHRLGSAAQGAQLLEDVAAPHQPRQQPPAWQALLTRHLAALAVGQVGVPLLVQAVDALRGLDAHDVDQLHALLYYAHCEVVGFATNAAQGVRL
mmetsp:Transcript_72910/g.188044  ORF Transcript_72910/g.188044 Transcript_72910/m.188044 type:complete len:265 (+) Transcript_72910:1092-1886(+)